MKSVVCLVAAVIGLLLRTYIAALYFEPYTINGVDIMNAVLFALIALGIMKIRELLKKLESEEQNDE